MTEIVYDSPSGSKNKAIRMILLIRDIDLVVDHTDDGMDFSLVAEDK